MPDENYDFSPDLRVFRDRHVPEGVRLCGYAALIHAYDLDIPLPRMLSGAKPSFAEMTADGWQLYSPRHLPDPGFAGHLTFALRYEPVDLLILKALFQKTGAAPVEDMVRASPNGQYARRAWFFFEWLTGTTLDLPDAGAVGYTNALNPDIQIACRGTNSQRHRVRNNLPGSADYCPLVTLTPPIKAFLERDLAGEAAAIIRPIGNDLVARAAAFLLLADSRSSFAIEGENPPQDRLQSWGQAIAQAGRNRLSHEELCRLQRIVIPDARFMRMGYRIEGGFVGERDRHSGSPLPEHISARAEDLQALMAGLLNFANTDASGLNPVVAAALIAFGFVYIHPFEDGNGRIHRYLIHHQLASSGFNPPGLVFPVSSAFLSRIIKYRDTLRSHSERILPFIRWRETETHNVEVLNETADFYRYFDATPHVQFLFECVAQTIERDLPEELLFLERYDRFKTRIEQRLALPDARLDLLFRFLKQNNGTLSQRARENEFAALTPEEAVWAETVYAEAFPPFPI